MKKILLLISLLLMVFFLLTVNADFQLHQVDDDCKFAIIIGGDVRADDDHTRYWSALQQKWAYLTGKNFSANNIWVNYVDGRDRDGGNKVDGPASADSVMNSFEKVAGAIAKCNEQGKKSEVMIFVIDHGVNHRGAVGIPLQGGDIFYDDAFAEMVETLNDAGNVDIWVELGQCFSGAFVDDLDGIANGAAASTGADQNHYSTRDRMRFEYHFIAALQGTYPDGNAIDSSDYNSTGNPWRDAYDYARKKYKAALKPGENSDPTYGGTGIPDTNALGDSDTNAVEDTNGVADEDCDYRLDDGTCCNEDEPSVACGTLAVCGDAEISADEICDFSAGESGCENDYTCNDICTACIPNCGNGEIDSGEECDPNYAGSGYQCEDGFICCNIECVCTPLG